MTEQSEDRDNQETQTKDTKEYNFAQIRKQLEQEREEKRQLSEKVSALEEQFNKSRQEVVEEDDDEDDSYIDERRLKKHLGKFEQKMQAQFESAAERKAASMLEKERQNAFLKNTTDFQEVLNAENIQRFADKYPDIAEQLVEMPDNFARQKLLYQNIKAFRVHEKEGDKSIQSVVDQKRKGPFYQPSGVANAPYSSAGDFTPGGQKNAYQQMQELKNRLRL